MAKKLSKNMIRQRKHVRVRRKISGTAECPRLNVFRSLSHMYAQIIDDTTGTTLVAASTLELKDKLEHCSNDKWYIDLNKLKISEEVVKHIRKQVCNEIAKKLKQHYGKL